MTKRTFILSVAFFDTQKLRMSSDMFVGDSFSSVIEPFVKFVGGKPGEVFVEEHDDFVRLKSESGILDRKYLYSDLLNQRPRDDFAYHLFDFFTYDGQQVEASFCMIEG